MKQLIILAGILAIAGCTSAPSLQTGPDAEKTFDGLVRVDNTLSRAVYVKPTIDISQYDKILPKSAGIQYRAVDPQNRYKRNASEFPLDEEQKARIEKEVAEVFQKALKGFKHFTMTDQPGKNVLRLEVGLADVVSHVPPQRGARDEFYISNLGEALMIMQISDSRTNEVLARVVDRRAIEPQYVAESNRVTNLSELRRSFGVWGQRIVSGLDNLHEMGCQFCTATE